MPVGVIMVAVDFQLLSTFTSGAEDVTSGFQYEPHPTLTAQPQQTVNARSPNAFRSGPSVSIPIHQAASTQNRATPQAP